MRVTGEKGSEVEGGNTAPTILMCPDLVFLSWYNHVVPFEVKKEMRKSSRYIYIEIIFNFKNTGEKIILDKDHYPTLLAT